MCDDSRLPERILTLADAERVAHAARTHHQPWCDGQVVWRCWGDGEPIVLLHGGSGSWNHWVRNIAPLVSAGRQVWVPDLPGFGDSVALGPDADADALPEPLEAGMRQLFGSASVDLLGFSFGTMVAAFIASRWPGRVRRLVLSGAPALGLRGAEPLVLRPWTHLPPGPALDAALRENLAILMLANPDPDDGLALALHADNLRRDRMRQRRLARTDILLRTLPSITCPVDGLWGADDVLYRGVGDQLADALAAAPGFRALRRIPGAGHWVQYERADAFNAALRDLLTG